MSKKHREQFEMFENVASVGGEPSTTFVQEIHKHLLLLKDEIKHYAQACTYTRNPFTTKPDDPTVRICNAMKVFRKSLKILHWPTSG